MKKDWKQMKKQLIDELNDCKSYNDFLIIMGENSIAWITANLEINYGRLKK